MAWLQENDEDNPLDPHFYCADCKNKVYLHDKLGRKMRLKHATYFLYKCGKITKKRIEKADNKIAKCS